MVFVVWWRSRTRDKIAVASARCFACTGQRCGVSVERRDLIVVALSAPMTLSLLLPWLSAGMRATCRFLSALPVGEIPVEDLDE